MLSILLTLLSAGQGEAVLLSVPTEAGLERVFVTWQGTDHRLAPGPDGGWYCWLGIDLDSEPGAVDVPVELQFADGRRRRQVEQLTIEPRDYPTTELTVAPRYVELDPDDQARAAEEAAEIAAIYATVTPEQMWDGPFVVPVAGAADGRNFGHRRVFNGQPRAPHSGADLTAALGTPVHAANAGRVVLAKALFFSGNAVFVDHGTGVYSVYLHLSEFRVAVGDEVGKGDLLGLAGATGRVTGPHLHWGVRIHDARVDPFSLIRALR